MQRTVILILIILLSKIAIAQQSRLDKAQTSLESENYEDVLFNADKALNNEATAKNIISFFYRAKALFELSKDESYLVKNPNTRRDAVAATIKLRKHKNWNSANAEFQKLFKEVVKDCEKTAMSYFNEKKYPKAKKEFENVVKLNGSVNARYMIAKITTLEDMKSGIAMYLVIIDSQYNAVRRGEQNVEVMLEPFVETLGYYKNRGSNDKALKVIEKGLIVFPGNMELTNLRYPFFIKSLKAKNNFKSNDSIITALKVYRSALQTYPDDTTVNRMFIKYAINFVSRKETKLKKPNYDSIANALTEKVGKIERLDNLRSYVWLVNYYAKAKESKPMHVYIDKYVAATYKKNPDWGYLSLSDTFLEMGDEELSREIYNMGVLLYPDSEALKSGKIPGQPPRTSKVQK